MRRRPGGLQQDRSSLVSRPSRTLGRAHLVRRPGQNGTSNKAVPAWSPDQAPARRAELSANEVSPGGLVRRPGQNGTSNKAVPAWSPDQAEPSAGPHIARRPGQETRPERDVEQGRSCLVSRPSRTLGGATHRPVAWSGDQDKTGSAVVLTLRGRICGSGRGAPGLRPTPHAGRIENVLLSIARG